MAKLQRRTNPSLCSSYKQYKRYLREDFAYCCVYCSIHENEHGGHRHFHVEHFRPKKHFPELIVTYTNLLYACGICNSFKGDDWPSDDPLTDGKGYLDPCEHDYEEYFKQLENYQLEGLTSAAIYMIEQLHLNRKQLQKMRERRLREERLHHRAMQLYEIALPSLAEALQHQDLPPTSCVIYGSSPDTF